MRTKNISTGPTATLCTIPQPRESAAPPPGYVGPRQSTTVSGRGYHQNFHQCRSESL
jgi:hypothetical protein